MSVHTCQICRIQTSVENPHTTLCLRCKHAAEQARKIIAAADALADAVHMWLTTRPDDVEYLPRMMAIVPYENAYRTARGEA